MIKQMIKQAKLEIELASNGHKIQSSISNYKN